MQEVLRYHITCSGYNRLPPKQPWQSGKLWNNLGSVSASSDAQLVAVFGIRDILVRIRMRKQIRTKNFIDF
jgi:hypothetical protein